MSNPVPTSDLIHKEDMQPMRLYAHWLDGEWSKIAYPRAVTGRESLQSIAVRTLKLHALFGTRVAISDVQLTDSPVTAGLFLDSGFREYLKHDSKFLTLVSHTREGTSHFRFALAKSGFDRARKGKHWATSFPGIPNEVIKRFGDAVLGSDSDNVAYTLSHPNCAPRQVIRENPEYAEALEGILYGIRHFTLAKGGPSELAQKSPESYMKFLKDMLDTHGLPSEKYNAIDQIRNKVISMAGEENLHGRSSLVQVMERQKSDRNQWSPEWHRIWNTVVHAWNSNVAATVGARESIAPLPYAVIPFRGEITDVASPFTSEDDQVVPTRLGSFPCLSFDPNLLTWTEILEIVRREDIYNQREVLRDAFVKQNSEAIAVAANGLVSTLKPLLIPHPGPFLRTIDVIRIVAETASAAVHLSGHGSLIPTHLTYADDAEILRHVVQSGKERYMVWNTLRRFKRNLISVFDAGKSAA